MFKVLYKLTGEIEVGEDDDFWRGRRDPCDVRERRTKPEEGGKNETGSPICTGIATKT